MIKGYPERASVAAGGRLVLHVATDAARFRVRFLRCGADLTLCETSGWLSGIPSDERTAGIAWDWPSYTFTIPKSWPSGAYIAQLVEAKARTITPNLGDTQGAVLFVVRGERRSSMLYKIPLATYHAYNYEGHGCYYADSPRSADPPGSRVTLHRAGGGIECDGAPLETFDTKTARATLASIGKPVGTPDNLKLLAVAPLSKQWNELPPCERFGAGEGIHAATMCVYERNGTVFTAATTDWAQVLDYDRNVDAITRNVIERLAG